MADKIVGQKVDMVQKFNPEGKRIVVTRIKIDPNLKLGKVFKQKDELKVTGWSKGKGFAGVVKRWGFKGGPKTHGQSDKQRAPGSIGQTTTPGRVFPGKKMAGRTGGAKVTIFGLKIFAVDETNNFLLIDGLVPGPRNGRLIVQKMETKHAKS